MSLAVGCVLVSGELDCYREHHGWGLVLIVLRTCIYERLPRNREDGNEKQGERTEARALRAAEPDHGAERDTYAGVGRHCVGR